MKLRKKISLCLATVLCLGVLTACGSASENQTSETGDETVEIEDMVYEQLEYPASTRTYTVDELKVEWAQEYTFYTYSGDVYIIRKDDAYGFYDISTDEIISECIYDLDSVLSDDGYMLAYRDDGTVFVLLDENGQELFSVENGTATGLPSEGTIIIGTPKPEVGYNESSNLYAIYTVEGEVLISGIDGAINPCSEGVFVVRVYATSPEQGNYFLDKDSMVKSYLENCSFKRADYTLSDGLVCVECNGGGDGYVGTDGQVAIAGSYYVTSDFSNGRAYVSKEENKYAYGIIDTQGNEITPFMYASVEICSDELIIVSMDEETYGLIDLDGNEVLPCVYVSIDVSEEGAIQANYSDENPYASQSPGAEPIPIPDIFFYGNGTLTQYDFIDDFSEGFARVQKDSVDGFIDEDGNEIVAPYYHSADSFSEGLAHVDVQESNVMHGYVDTTGTLVIPCIYSEGGDFKDGLAQVILDGRYLFIDTQGNEVYEFDREKNPNFSLWTYGDLQGGLMRMKYTSDEGESVYCMVDIYGNIAIDEGVFFYDGLGERGFIGEDGYLVLINNPLLLD